MSGGSTKKRKFKKSKPPNIRYKAEHRHEKGHARRIKKHLLRHPDDKVSITALERYGAWK